MKPLSALLFSALMLGTGACARGDGGPAPMSEETVEGRIDFSRTTEFDGNVLTVDVSSRDGGTFKAEHPSG